MENGLYSIVIPAYNEGARIGKALTESLALRHEQGWRAEILVVNDGSTDDTARQVKEFAAHNPDRSAAGKPRKPGQGLQRAPWGSERVRRDCAVYRRRSLRAHGGGKASV